MKVPSLSEKIQQHLKADILAGRLLPGQRLTIDDIASQLDVSPMPVRDAVRRLDALGFLRVAPRRGVYVAEYDQAKFKNILEIRTALECLAVDLSTAAIPASDIDAAIQRYQEAGRRFSETGDPSALVACDSLVHDLVIQYCNNPELMALMDQLKDLIDWGHYIVAAHLPQARETALDEHLRILFALSSRDAERTKEAVREHLGNTYKRTMQAWQGKEHR